jgi:hypothetical protein
LIFDWLTNLRAAHRRNSRRAYYALREAQALRMQYGDAAEAWCATQLAQQGLGSRRKRFLSLVAKALASA